MPFKIEFDGALDIATGKSRKETSWKNKKVQWSAVLEKCSTTHRTAESYAEYIASKKPRQDEIKDIGGFVGGYLTSGRRKPENVAHRQLVTLDIDFAPPDVWDDFTLHYICAAAIYSTHKHSEGTPRFRLIIPLSREVFSDEYTAIARKIAGRIGIEYFDHTTFQPSRLMYWPSSAKDGEYVFQYQDGPWLDADKILASYVDWKDSSEWPVSSKFTERIKESAKEQGDPLTKKNMIGSFCRTYTISEAIDAFLSDVYEPSGMADRYTFTQGSTAGGLVIYDDKFAYSHHGTDPASESLTNAFDLVRIHKFGGLDKKSRFDTPMLQRPSFKAMEEFVQGDKNVRVQRGAEILESAQLDFSDSDFDDEATEGINLDWFKSVEIDKKGNPISSINNIYLILKNDPKLKDRIFLNEFDGRMLITKNLPWRKLTPQTRDFTDDDSDCLAHYVECYNTPFTHVQKALAKIRNENKFHPVRDYLKQLTWDGKPRLDNLFIDYLGAESSEYSRAIARKTLVAAVARVMEPGIKFDTVLTIVGKEGIGKSTLIAKLAGQWFSDCLGDIHNKEGMESLRGVWIMEIAELSSFRKADQEAIKRFITSREDVYRPAYGKQLVRYPRQCIVFATTNEDDFLSAGHIHRRFLPLRAHIQDPTKSVFTDLTQTEINQIWAEAVTMYNRGESLHLNEEITQAAGLAREKHSKVDDREGMVEKYLETLLPENWDEMGLYDKRAFLHGDEELLKGVHQRKTVCAAEIWCEALGGMQKDMTSQNTKFIHDIMKKMKGWMLLSNPQKFGNYGKQRGYVNVKIPSKTPATQGATQS